MPTLDRYEMDGIAEPPEDYDPEAELEARLRAERELDDRDAAEGRAGPGGGRVRPRALEADDDDDQWRRQQRRRRAADRDEEDEDEEVRSRWHTKPGTPTGRKSRRATRDSKRSFPHRPFPRVPSHSAYISRRAQEEEFEVDIENYDCPLREWITRERTKVEIRRKFSRFLRKFTAKEDGELVYRKRIREMCVSNRQSLEVSYLHLSQREPMLAIWVADAPADMLEIFNGVAKQEALKLYPAYESIVKDIFVRVTELPILDQIRDIRQAHLNCLIKISGVVTRRTGVFPQLQGGDVRLRQMRVHRRAHLSAEGRGGDSAGLVPRVPEQGSVESKHGEDGVSQLSAVDSAGVTRERSRGSPSAKQGDHPAQRSHRSGAARRRDRGDRGVHKQLRSLAEPRAGLPRLLHARGGKPSVAQGRRVRHP